MKRLALWVALSVNCASIYAEGGSCPNGYYPVNGYGVSGCAPIPGYNQRLQTPPSAQTQWRSRWGAIATDEVNGVVGSSSGLSREAHAKEAALADCKSKGGESCRFAVSYANGCGAMIAGDNRFNVDRAATEQEAIEIGMRTCQREDKNCRVYFTSCSYPVRIQ